MQGYFFSSLLQVIDMTGREQKVYYSYSQMSNKHSVPDEGPPTLSTQDQKGSGFALPELEHNLQLLIDLTEQDILQVGVNQISLDLFLSATAAPSTC